MRTYFRKLNERSNFRKLNESDTNSDWYYDLYKCLDKNELSKMIFDYPDFANKKYKKLNIFFEPNYKSTKLDIIRKTSDIIIDNGRLVNIDINKLNFKSNNDVNNFIIMYEASLKEFFKIKIKELLSNRKYDKCVSKFSEEELDDNIKIIVDHLLGDYTDNTVYFLNYDSKENIYYLCYYTILMHHGYDKNKINSVIEDIYVLNDNGNYDVANKNILIEIGKENCNYYKDISLLGCAFTLYSGYFDDL